MADTKVCSRCSEEKELSEYYKFRHSPDGHQCYCKPCEAAAKRQRLKDRPFHTTIEQVRHRAAKKGLPFDLTEEYLDSIFTGVCPAFYVRLTLPREEPIPGYTYKSSLDRIIPEKGYVKGNVIFLSDLANRIKAEADHQQIQAVATWLHHIEKEIEAYEADRDRPN